MLPGARVLNVPFMFTGYLQDQDARLEDINKSSNCINPAPRRGCRAERHPPRRPTLDSPDSPPPAIGWRFRATAARGGVAMTTD